jgi:dTDP-4-amino-4,6-dideoxygalactose transaminase
MEVSAASVLAVHGGPPVRTRPWPTYDKGCVFLDNKEEQAAREAIRSRRLFRYDDRALHLTFVGQLEAALAEFFGVKHVLAVSSGTAALALAFFALGIKEGDEVLCSSFGFPASVSSIVLAGAKPVLVEVDDDLHVDLDDLEAKIGPRTKAVLMVHMRGQCGNVKGVARLCEEYGLPLVEDAVPILGAKYDGQYIGTFGKIGAFSTQSDKSLNTGEGGFLVTQDDLLFERAVAFSGAYEGRVRKHCKWPLKENYLKIPLFNFRMDELRGAVALVQLARLPSRLETMRCNYKRACEALGRHPEIKVRNSHRGEGTLGDNVVFRLRDSTPADAQWFTQAICAEGIEARCFGVLGKENVRSFWTWEFMFPGKSRDEIRRSLPRAAQILDLTIDVPLSPTLQPEDLADFERAFDKVIAQWRLKRGNEHPAVVEFKTASFA